MRLPDLDSALWAAGLAGSVLLILTLFRRRTYRSFPVFTAYLLFTLLVDLPLYWVRGHMSEQAYFNAYFIASVPDYLLQLAVLLEIGANVVRPVKRSLPIGVLWLLAGLIFLGSTAALLLTLYSTPHFLARISVLYSQMNLAVAFLRLAVFGAIALFAQLLGIGWKNHVLQLATGLAFYSAVGLVVVLAQNRMGLTGEFHALDQIQVASYVAALVFWIWSFAAAEAPRKDFSPQMQNFLVSIAGTARTNRMVIRGRVTKD